MTKRRVDLLVLGSKETITVDGAPDSDDLGIIDGGGVAVNNGVVVEAASSQLLERKYQAKSVVDVPDEIVLPGFVDPHTHLVFNGSREEEFQLRVQGVPYMEVLRRGRGILETVNRTRQTHPEELLRISVDRLNTALVAGTTTIEIKSGYGLRLHDELKILKTTERLAKQHPCRILATFLGAHAIPPDYSDPRDYVRTVIEEMLPRVQAEKVAQFCDVFCEQGAFDAKLSLKILKAATRLGLRPKIHADEFSNSGGTRVANKTLAVSADHLVHSPPKELEKMLETGVTPVLLPASSHSLLMSQYAEAREMLSMDLPVALGTDFSPANWVLGQLTVAAIAARQLRMTAAEIIRGITINASKALGLDRKIGSISPGKEADLTILRAPNHKWIGYTFGESIVDKVLIGGKVVVDNGKRVR